MELLWRKTDVMISWLEIKGGFFYFFSHAVLTI